MEILETSVLSLGLRLSTFLATGAGQGQLISLSELDSFTLTAFISSFHFLKKSPFPDISIFFNIFFIQKTPFYMF